MFRAIVDSFRIYCVNARWTRQCARCL